MFELLERQSFDAAHFLRDYDGKCGRLHGHTWAVEAKVRGSELDCLGMLVDFKALTAALREILDVFDHRCLNDLPEFSEENPTAENIAKIIFDRLASHEVFDGSRAFLYEVSVWESAHSSASYKGR